MPTKSKPLQDPYLEDGTRAERDRMAAEGPLSKKQEEEVVEIISPGGCAPPVGAGKKK